MEDKLAGIFDSAATIIPSFLVSRGLFGIAGAGIKAPKGETIEAMKGQLALTLPGTTFMSPDAQAKALVGRKNSNAFLFPHEKSLFPVLPKDDKSTYRSQRFLNSPLLKAVPVAAAGALAALVKEQLPMIREELPNLKNALPPGFTTWIPTDINHPALQFLEQTPAKYLVGGALLAGGAVAAASALNRLMYPTYVKTMAGQGRFGASAEIENAARKDLIRKEFLDKQAEIPVALLDDAVVLAARLANSYKAETSPQPDTKTNLTIKNIKKQIATIEKQAGKPSPVLSEAWRAMLKTKGKKNDKSRSNNGKNSPGGKDERSNK